jgi:glycerol uptake facilitator-like aquaporin
MAFNKSISLDLAKSDQNEPEEKIKYTSDLLLTYRRLWSNRSAGRLPSMTLKKLRQACLRYWISAFLLIFCLCALNDAFSLFQEPKLWAALLMGFAIFVAVFFLDVVSKKRKSGPQ